MNLISLISTLKEAYSGPVRVHHPRGKPIREVVTYDDPPICLARFKHYIFRDSEGHALPSFAPANANLFRHALDPDYGYLALAQEVQLLRQQNEHLRQVNLTLNQRLLEEIQ